MTLKRIGAVSLLCVFLGCAAVSDRHKMEKYGRTMDSYQTAMRVSDFNIACRYVDSEVMDRSECMRRYENLKIASYDILSAKVADDSQNVDLTVEATYFLLDRYIVKKVQFEQSWHYDDTAKSWMLQTGPPHFK